MQQKPLHDKIAWITGAGRGIGRAVAVTLARAGATVILGARTVDDCRQVAEVLRAEGLSAHAEHLDVTNRESIARFSEKSLAMAGPPTILVNNAGIGLFKDMAEMAHEDFDRQVDVNLKGPWYMAHAAVPHMKRLGEGHIINVSSIAGTHAFKRGTAYCAAKAGLNAMSEAMMLELREFGIRVTTIAPGSVQTGFHAAALPAANAKDQSWMVEPETIAAACLHVLTLPENAMVSHYEIRPSQPK